MGQRVGVVGLGKMGGGIERRLRGRGVETVGFDLNPSLGGCATLGELVERADVILLSLPDARAVESAVLSEGGLAELARAEQVVVDTSTSRPEIVVRAAARLYERGVDFLDAPVSGGRAGAEAGTLTMLVGGDRQILERVEPTLSLLTSKRVHLGAVGTAQTAKLLNNLLVATGLVAVGEALRAARAAGLDDETFIAAINESSGRSAVTEVNVPRWILGGVYDSGFTMKLMRKDVEAAIDLASGLGVEVPVHAAAGLRWSESVAALGDDEDFNRIVELE